MSQLSKVRRLQTCGIACEPSDKVSSRSCSQLSQEMRQKRLSLLKK